MPPLVMVNVPSLQLLELELALARPSAEVGDRPLDLGDRELVAVAHHRHDQALVGADRDSEMVVVLVDEVGAVDFGVDRGDLLQRLHARLHEEAHEAELGAVLLLEGVLVAGAHRHHLGHVDLVEGGQHRGGVLRVLEAARDRLAKLRHPHPLLAGAVVGSRGAGRRRRDGRQAPEEAQ